MMHLIGCDVHNLKLLSEVCLDYAYRFVAVLGPDISYSGPAETVQPFK